MAMEGGRKLQEVRNLLLPAVAIETELGYDYYRVLRTEDLAGHAKSSG